MAEIRSKLNVSGDCFFQTVRWLRFQTVRWLRFQTVRWLRSNNEVQVSYVYMYIYTNSKVSACANLMHMSRSWSFNSFLAKSSDLEAQVLCRRCPGVMVMQL